MTSIYPRGYNTYVRASVACAVVVAALALMLVGTLIGLVPKGLQRVGFGVGLATYCIWWVSRWYASSGEYGVGATLPLGFAPPVLLLEAGAVGFLSFNSKWRYTPLALSIWAAIRILRTLVSFLYLRLSAKRG